MFLDCLALSSVLLTWVDTHSTLLFQLMHKLVSSESMASFIEFKKEAQKSLNIFYTNYLWNI